MYVRRTIARGLIAATLALAGCGGGGSSGGGSGGMDDITWPDRDGGTTTELPPSVLTGRVVFSSESGEACCVAVDPSILSGSAQRGLAILTDLPIGPATVRVAGFTTTFAPAVPGIVDTCMTVPADAAHPCDPVQLASPAFESPPLFVVIVGGAQTNIGEVPMEAFPFLLNFSPAQDSSAPAPVQFAMTVVDAATNVRQDSVELEVRFTVPDENQETSGSPFRVLSKRVPLTLEPCADGTTMPCNPTANLQLAGFAATGTAPELPEGPVEARVTAENLGDPPRGLDFRYSFNVLATPTATGTATPSSADESGATADGAAPADDTSTTGEPAHRLTDSPADSESEMEPPATTPAGAAVNRVPPTPTATPLRAT